MNSVAFNTLVAQASATLTVGAGGITNTSDGLQLGGQLNFDLIQDHLR